MKLSIVPLSKENIQDLVYLNKQVFGLDFSPKQLQSKYNDEYKCFGASGLLAYNNTKPVGFYGLIPQVFEHNGIEYKATHSCDYMTLKEYRGKGVHFQLAERVDEIHRQNEIDFTYGMLAGMSIPRAKKHEWEYLHRMQRFHIGTPGIAKKVLYKLPVLDNLKRENVINRLSKYKVDTDVLTNPLLNEGYLAHKYTKEEFNYIQSKNKFCIELSGVKLFVKATDRLDVGIVESASEESYKKVLSELERLKNELGVKEVLLQLMPNSSFAKLVSQSHTGKDSFILGYKLYNKKTPIERLGLNFIDLDSF